MLAGVAISQLTNSGLFNKAKIAGEYYSEKQEEENAVLSSYEEELSKYVSGASRDNIDYQLIWFGTADSTGDYYLNVKNEETEERYSWTDFKFVLIVGHDPKGSEDKTMLIPTFLTSDEVGSNWTVDGSNGAKGGQREICFSLGQNKFTVTYVHTEQIRYIYGIN